MHPKVEMRAVGVSLVQGYLLGRPPAPWPPVTVPQRLAAPEHDAAPAPATTLHDAQA
jgi:hypothetical protein